jgi:hypothetical protein
VYHCTKCHLYWFDVGDGILEFRLAVFSPIKIKDCPFCEGTNQYPPTERFLDMQKVGRKEMLSDEYFKKYKTNN